MKCCDTVFSEGDKCFLFSKFKVDPDLFQKFPLKLYPGIFLALTPQHVLVQGAGKDSSEKERIALAGWVLPGFGLGLGACNVCIQIDKTVQSELRDEYFWFMMGALLLTKPLDINISGSFSYGTEEIGFLQNPHRICYRSNISIDAFLSSWRGDNLFQYNEGDFQRAGAFFIRIIEIFRNKQIAPRPYFVLNAFFEAVMWEQLHRASTMFSKLFPLVDAFSGNTLHGHAEKVSKRLSLFLSGISSILLSKPLSTEEVQHRLKSIWKEHRAPHLHGFPKEPDTPPINGVTQNPVERPEVRDLFDLMEIARGAVIKMLLLEKDSYQEFCLIPISKQYYSSKKDMERAGESRDLVAEKFFVKKTHLTPCSWSVYTDFSIER